MRIVLVAFATVAVFAFGEPGRASADCLSDCSNTYQTAMAACQAQYGATGQEIQLQDCMDTAEAQLAQCNGACEMPD